MKELEVESLGSKSEQLSSALQSKKIKNSKLKQEN
jgi:hypothetical protein